MSCNTPHPTQVTVPRNANVSCFWHANGNLVCNTTGQTPTPSAAHPTPSPATNPSTLNVSPFAITNTLTNNSTTPTATFTGASPQAPYAEWNNAPEFTTFGEPNQNYHPNAYRQHTEWYNTQNQPCCDVPCKSCTSSEPSFRSPPRTYARTHHE